MAKQTIRSMRKGSVQWNEEDRLALAALLIKCGYAVKITHQVVLGQAASRYTGTGGKNH